jgi:hypothetical protein
MVDLNGALEGLTDEQLLALINGVKANGDGKQETKKKVRVQLIGGEVVEGDSAEEVNQILAQRLAAASTHQEEVEEPPQSNNNPNQPRLPKFDYKTFEKKFVEDPIAGQEYLEITQYGVPLKTLITQMAGALGTSMKKLQELETQTFIDTTEGYEPSVENRKAIQKVMDERGWQTSRQTLEDAFAIASAKGMIQTKDAKKSTRKAEPEDQFIPPRTRHSSEETNAEFELMNQLGNLTDQQIHDLAVKAGIVRQ